MYTYPWQPPLPKRDAYLLAIGITSLVGSILVLLAGLGTIGLLALITVLPHSTLKPSQYFASIVLFISFACAGIVGGSFGLYHSIRSVFLRKPSADFAMPQFWIFFLLYLAVIGAAYLLQIRGMAITYPAVTVILIAFAAIFPALTILALGDRRLHFPRKSPWPTSWRRFTLAIISGATLGVALAVVLEYILELLLVHGQVTNPLLCVDQPNAQNCQNPGVYNIILVVVAIMAPLIEESVKPLAVIRLGLTTWFWRSDDHPWMVLSYSSRKTSRAESRRLLDLRRTTTCCMEWLMGSDTASRIDWPILQQYECDYRLYLASILCFSKHR